MCIVFSIVGCVYWYPRVTLSSMFVGESSYVSFSRYFFLCIHFDTSFVREWDEWPSPRGFGLLSLPSLHSLLMWLHSMFDLSWSSLFFIYSLFLYHPHYCFQFIFFISPSYPCLITTYSSSLCLLVRVRMWAFRDMFFFVFTLSHLLLESEMSDLLLGALGYCPFHYYIHYWYDFTPRLIWVDHHSSSYIHCFTIILTIAFDSSSSFHPLVLVL